MPHAPFPPSLGARRRTRGAPPLIAIVSLLGAGISGGCKKAKRAAPAPEPPPGKTSAPMTPATPTDAKEQRYGIVLPGGGRAVAKLGAPIVLLGRTEVNLADHQLGATVHQTPPAAGAGKGNPLAIRLLEAALVKRLAGRKQAAIWVAADRRATVWGLASVLATAARAGFTQLKLITRPRDSRQGVIDVPLFGFLAQRKVGRRGARHRRGQPMQSAAKDPAAGLLEALQNARRRMAEVSDSISAISGQDALSRELPVRPDGKVWTYRVALVADTVARLTDPQRQALWRAVTSRPIAFAPRWRVYGGARPAGAFGQASASTRFECPARFPDTAAGRRTVVRLRYAPGSARRPSWFSHAAARGGFAGFARCCLAAWAGQLAIDDAGKRLPQGDYAVVLTPELLDASAYRKLGRISFLERPGAQGAPRQLRVAAAEIPPPTALRPARDRAHPTCEHHRLELHLSTGGIAVRDNTGWICPSGKPAAKAPCFRYGSDARAALTRLADYLGSLRGGRYQAPHHWRYWPYARDYLNVRADWQVRVGALVRVLVRARKVGYHTLHLSGRFTLPR